MKFDPSVLPHSEEKSMLKPLAFSSPLLGAALAGLLMASGCSSTPDPSPANAGTASPMGECHGINGCKGMSDCGGKAHACAGHNACKGKGWKKMSKKNCEDRGGEFKS